MPDVTPTLHDILANHGVETKAGADGWLSTNGAYPACRAYTNEPQMRDGGCTLRFDVEVALTSNRLIIESFSDFGVDANAAFRSSLRNFCAGSLHVMLSGLWGISDPDQVLVEGCRSGNQEWTLHLGNIVRKAEHGIEVPPPDDLMPLFDNLIAQAEFEPFIHWGRIFYANMPNTENIAEALFDNNPWPAGECAVRSASWPQLSSFYSARMFWILVPKETSA